MFTQAFSQTNYPATRLRRTRAFAWSRALVAETELTVNDLILPLFVHDKHGPASIPTLPDVYRHDIEGIINLANEAASLGIPAIALFPVTSEDKKCTQGKEALNPDNLICRTIQAVKRAVPNIGVIADVALDPYTSHGHDGLLDSNNRVDNDATVGILAEQALLLAKSGCDIVAPSDMMDGRVQAIRTIFETNKLFDKLILSYSAKYTSSFYGPFRDAVGSASSLGTSGKHTYQMDSANANEALREIQLDITEGADAIMIKPAVAYLDIMKLANHHFSLPLLAYHVSGEYAMLKYAAMHEAVTFLPALTETLLCIKRAGACGIFTYGALEAARYLQEKTSM